MERARTKHTPLSLNCSPESCSHEKRDGTILTQQDALDDLKLVSQARGARLAELPGYSYDSRGGQGITVYVIDTGINPNHPVSVIDYSKVNKTYSFPGIPKYAREHILAASTG